MKKMKRLPLAQQLESVGHILVGLGRNPEALKNLAKAVKKKDPELYLGTIRGQLPPNFPLPDCITFTRTLQAVLKDPVKKTQTLIKIDQTRTFCPMGGRWADA